MQALAECVKAIQGMTGNARNTQAAQDLHRIVDTTQAPVQANPHKFDKTTTPDDIHNMQQVLRVQAPPSDLIPHTNDNRQITRSMHSKAPILRVPTDISKVKPISVPLITTTIEPRSKPTTLDAESSKRERHCKQQATWLCNAITPTIPTQHIRTWAQLATAAAQVAPPSLNTPSGTQQLGVPPPTRSPGFAAAVMKQQRHQRGLVRLTHRITKLENKVHQAIAVIDKDTGKLLNYRQLMNSPKYKKTWSLSAANKFGRLANGIGGLIKNPTNTIEFIFQHKVPGDHMKDVMYRPFVCLARSKKAEPNQMRFMVGGDRIKQSCHPDRRNAGGQNAIKLCHLHKGCVIHGNGHFQLLPYDTSALCQIHTNQVKWFPWWSYQRIQA